MDIFQSWKSQTMYLICDVLKSPLLFYFFEGEKAISFLEYSQKFLRTEKKVHGSSTELTLGGFPKKIK